METHSEQKFDGKSYAQVAGNSRDGIMQSFDLPSTTSTDWPTKANEDEKGPKRRQMRRLGHTRYVIFLMYNLLFYFCYTAANEGQQRQTQVNKGQRRPMRAH